MLFELFAQRLRRLHPHVEVVVGLEARGLLIAAAVAPLVQAACVPVRKRGKLPGATRSSGYEKEYGADALEIQTESIRTGQRCAIIDDLVATGGSLRAAVSLVEGCGGIVVECCVLIRLVELRQEQQQVTAPLHSFIDC
jgi:adenine phosphoribosyltransferase